MPLHGNIDRTMCDCCVLIDHHDNVKTGFQNNIEVVVVLSLSKTSVINRWVVKLRSQFDSVARLTSCQMIRAVFKIFQTVLILNRLQPELRRLITFNRGLLNDPANLE